MAIKTIIIIDDPNRHLQHAATITIGISLHRPGLQKIL